MQPCCAPQPETYCGNVSTTGPRACYDEGKRSAEALMFAYSAQYKIEIRVARIFNTFGPYLSKWDGRIVSTFIRQCISAEPISIYGDGKQTRTLCYIQDTIAGLLALMQHDSFSGPVNIGGIEELTVSAIAKLVCTAANKPDHPVSYGPLPVDDPSRRKPCLNVAKEILKWEPRVAVTDGIKLTLEWFFTT